LSRWCASSLKIRILFWVLLLVLAAIWGLAARIATVLRTDLQQAISDHLSVTVGYVVNDIDNKIQLRIDTLKEIAASITPEMLAEPAKVHHLLEQRNVSRQLFPIGIFVADRQGINIAEHPRVAGRLGGSIADRDYFTAVMAGGELAVGKPIQGRFWKQAIVAMALPLRDASGATAGVLIGAIILSGPELFGQLEQTRIGKTGFLLVVSPRDRLIVSATDKSRILTPVPARGVNPVLDQRLEAGIENAAIAVNSQGVETLSVSRNLKTTGWLAIAGISSEEAFAPIGKLKQQIYLAALVISLALVLVLRYVLVRQLAPLAEASNAMRLMTRNQKAFATLPVRRNDEIGHLVENFNLLVSERKRLDEALRSSEERWKFALEGAGEGVWDWNIETAEVDFSQRWKEMLGYTGDEVCNTFSDWQKLVHPDDLPLALAAIEAYFGGKTQGFVIEHRLLCKDGGWKWILSRGIVTARNAEGRPLRMIGTHTDITERKRMETELRALATTDFLTGLPNRRSFIADMEEQLARQQRLTERAAVLMLDLDHFKQVNDSHGHAIGDAVLRHFVALLVGELRKIDTAGRVGGEEFAIILPGADAAAARVFAERLRQKAEDTPFLHQGQTIPVTVSIGIAAMRASDRDADAILARADIALYRAKEAGRNRVELEADGG